MRGLLMLELDALPDKLVSILHYNGLPVPSDQVVEAVSSHLQQEAVA